VANLSGTPARRRCSLPIGRSRQVGRGGEKRRASHDPRLSGLGSVGSVVTGSAPAAIPSDQKHPGLPQTLTVRAAGRSRPRSRFAGAGLPDPASAFLRTTKGVRQVVTSRPLRDLRACWLGLPQAGAVLPSGVRSVSSGRPCRSLVSEQKFRPNRMRRNSGFCARNSRSRGVLMLSDGCRSR
jgi:hypothetical protein